MSKLFVQGLLLCSLPCFAIAAPATTSLLPSAYVAAPVTASSNAFAVAAESDPAYQSIEAHHAFFLPTLGRDFVFVAGGQFANLPGGRAKLTGIIARKSDPAKRFEVDIDFSQPALPGDPQYGNHTPSKSLEDQAYAENGGPVDPAEWSYFARMRGTLRGLDDYAGALIRLSNNRLPATQMGIGANDLNVELGAYGEFTYKAVSQPTSGEFINPTLRRGRMNIGLDDSMSSCTNEAVNNPDVRPSDASHALYLPGISNEFVFVQGGRFVEFADGSAKLMGIVARADQPDAQFEIDVDFVNRLDPGMPSFPPTGSPKRELLDTAYIENGGTIDTSTWHYYETMLGTLRGLGDYSGALLTLENRGPAFQLGLGANGKNTNPGLSGWLQATTIQQPDDSGITFPSTTNGDFNIDLDGSCGICTTPAEADPELARYGGGHEIWIPGIATDMVFVSGGWLFEDTDGHATLTGIIQSESDPTNRWSVDLEFLEAMAPGDPSFPPAGSPKLELEAAAYTMAGGPVNPDMWRYYETTTGTLIGLEAYEGAELAIERKGPAFQIGMGASGKNLNEGASGWFDITTVSQPDDPQLELPSSLHGDVNVDLGDCETCPTGSETEFRVSRGPTALWLGSLGTDYEFEDGASLVETAEGTAHLTGVVTRRNDPCSRWSVDIEFSGHMLPGDQAYPPAGSPKLEFRGDQYEEDGGSIDPNLWHYYTVTSGTLTGLDCFEGGLVEVTRMGPAFQLGLGANNKNTELGASGWLTLSVLAQPTQGPPLDLSSGGQGDLYLDLRDCPETN